MIALFLNYRVQVSSDGGKQGLSLEPLPVSPRVETHGQTPPMVFYVDEITSSIATHSYFFFVEDRSPVAKYNDSEIP